MYSILKTLINCPKCLDKLLGYDDYDVVNNEKIENTISYQYTSIIVNSPKEIRGENTYQDNTNSEIIIHQSDSDNYSNKSESSWENLSDSEYNFYNI